MSCKWNGRQQPRVLSDRHAEECQSPTCAGCLPCPEDHCRVCGIAHSDGTCPECLAVTRDLLHGIGRMCDALPDEVEHRGIDGEAMVLLGPAADPEARGHLEASVLAGRVSADYLESANDERHPLFVLGSWDAVWRDALEHGEPTERLTIAAAIDYLDRQMSYMGGFVHVPFEDFARDLRQCSAHLESVLHDGEQIDRGAPCLACNVPQERVWGDLAASDGWRCPRCRTTSTEAQYRFAVKAEHMANAEWLSAPDCAESMDGAITAGTVRSWATKGLVRKRRDAGRTLYNRADVSKAASAEEVSA